MVYDQYYIRQLFQIKKTRIGVKKAEEEQGTPQFFLAKLL